VEIPDDGPVTSLRTEVAQDSGSMRIRATNHEQQGREEGPRRSPRRIRRGGLQRRDRTMRAQDTWHQEERAGRRQADQVPGTVLEVRFRQG
jgi:hypothetical protein